MAGDFISTTFSERTGEKLRFAAKKLHLTPQQLVRQLVEEGLLKYNVFEMAGGTLPQEDSGVQEVQDQDHSRNRI